MSDFESIVQDAAYEAYISHLMYEKEMEVATLQQRIYLFVEGVCEKETFPELLARAQVDVDKLGIFVANFNGIGNLLPALSLLHSTLSYDRPVIVTFDNDEEGRRVNDRLKNVSDKTDLFTVLPIPSVVKPIVYQSGHKGGSFEEMFPCDHFVDQIFSSDFMPEVLVNSKVNFLKEFREDQGWLNQVSKYCVMERAAGLANRKVEIASKLVETYKGIPPDIQKLAELIRETRDKYPVRHPSDIAYNKIEEEDGQKGNVG